MNKVFIVLSPFTSMLPIYQELLKKAQIQYDAAHHLLTITFPLIKDPKLLMGITSNILASLEYSMEAILDFNQPLTPKNISFQGKINLFGQLAQSYNIPKQTIHLLQDLKEIQLLHKKSPMIFPRGNRYVIANEDYLLKVISIDEIKGFLVQNSELLKIAKKVTKT